ncbi:hypothetical protein Hypma_003451 [Hypsizygus marmoreus]|uniref:Uncharacterized protein n=1 Tax=Hypsizygus marmoreus TaxID=39966 RepID=A0A369J6N2_HYPMA|nr:hypothetical protein Hypma_003451 [Hypsizygus marmoreus]
MPRFSALVSLLTLSLASVASAGSSCVAFDINWNLLAFGFNGKDYDAGTKDTWDSGTAADITTSGRPPFDGTTTNCYLSQFANAIYVLGADSTNPSSVYIYDATAKSWSTQFVTADGFDPTSFSAILDHDTNVFYALSKGEIYSLDMGLLKAANATALSWTDVQKPAFNTDNYQPVMALAQNHIHFLDVPEIAAGSALIFVIHFSYLQPEPQSYGQFPATHGQVTSLFKETGVQQEFAFIPDDGSATYVINVETNSTQTLKGPTVKDPMASYFASTDSLVQLSSKGSVSFLPYSAGATSSNTAASWSTIAKLPSALSTTGGSGTGSGTGNVTGSGSPTNSAKGAAVTGNGGSDSGSNGALSLGLSAGWLGGMLVFGVTALFL